MTGPLREVIIDIHPDRRARFAVALEHWIKSERGVLGIAEMLADRVKVRLVPVLVVDPNDPRCGQWHDDRERALRGFKNHVSPEFVKSVQFEGRDWNA